MRKAEQGESIIQRALLHRKAADVYRGELLPGCLDDWAFVERERLERAFARAMKQLVAHLEEQGNTEHALEYALHTV